MYMGVVWCGTRKSGKTPPFSPIFQPICMQMCPLHILSEGKASKHAQSKLLNFSHFTWFLPSFYLRNTLGLYFVVTSHIYFGQGPYGHAVRGFTSRVNFGCNLGFDPKMAKFGRKEKPLDVAQLLEGQEGQDECKHQDWSHVHELQTVLNVVLSRAGTSHQ